MSNNVVGNVYQHVIEEVINASRVDFEEGGVDDSVLEELRKGWQQKLSQLEVAAFPWDPKPDQTPAPSQQAAAAAPPAQDTMIQPNYSQAELSPPVPSAGIALPGGPSGVPDVQVKQEPGIKQEPGLPNYQPTPAGSNIATQRALANIQQRYGDEKADRIGQSHAAGAGQRAGQQPLPGHQQYRPPQPGAVPQQPQYPGANPSQPGMHNSQVDGAGEDSDEEVDEIQGVLMQRDAEGTLHELGRVDIDRLMHAQFMARAKAMEGGGLMLPLKEATKHKTAVSKKGKERATGTGQYDGEDDDIADEDAINSDLDDSDEDKDEEEVDDEGLGHIMLCMYDKVQRVKNKWKCVLKDGVLTVNGKEYVFHKATGEYEW